MEPLQLPKRDSRKSSLLSNASSKNFFKPKNKKEEKNRSVDLATVITGMNDVKVLPVVYIKEKKTIG